MPMTDVDFEREFEELVRDLRALPTAAPSGSCASAENATGCETVPGFGVAAAAVSNTGGALRVVSVRSLAKLPVT